MNYFISKFRIIISFALRDFSKSRFVLMFTIIGLSSAFTAVFLSRGILDGFRTTLESGAVDVIGHLIVYPQEGEDEIEKVDSLIEKIKKIDNVQALSLRNQTFVMLEYKGHVPGSYTGLGIDFKQESQTTKLPFDIVEGRFLSGKDSKEIVIGQNLADALVDLEYDGEKVPVGAKVQVITTSGQKISYKVVGILDGKTFVPNWMAYFNKDEMERIEPQTKNNQIIIKLKDENFLEETRELIQSQNPNVRVRTWHEEATYVDDMVLATQFITGSIVVLLVISVIIVTSVIIFINVYNRRRQIGILKSMGASNRFIIIIYLSEALLYSTTAFIFGFLFFMLINIKSIENPIPLLIGDFHTEFNSRDIVPLALIFVVATFGGSLFPALSAAKTRIADVLRNVI